jgi:hypothetical protein
VEGCRAAGLCPGGTATEAVKALMATMVMLAQWASKDCNEAVRCALGALGAMKMKNPEAPAARRITEIE